MVRFGKIGSITSSPVYIALKNSDKFPITRLLGFFSDTKTFGSISAYDDKNNSRNPFIRLYKFAM